ncbi:hypothetical protein HK100_003932, partial [Physocladia obscura]
METPIIKTFHVFISYRVNTDADLAEKLCDKLQAMVILNEQREIRFRCFLDKQNLTVGHDYEDQFLDGLRKSCLFLPLISEACLNSMVSIQAGWTDNVVKEWQTALSLQKNSELDIIPILVGSHDSIPGSSSSSKAYRRFDGFGTVSKLPNFAIGDSPDTTPIRTVVGDLLKLQGIFLNPEEITDKLSGIVSKFSSQVWPTYRQYWENQNELGPEPLLTCVQCLQPYAQSQNGEGACRFHLTDGPYPKYSSTYECCGTRDSTLGCARNHHNPKHHNKFKYGSWYNWRSDLVNYTDKSKTLVKVCVDDFSHEYSDGSIFISLGATLRGAGIYANALYLSGYVPPSRPWFNLFLKDELALQDANKPIFELKGDYGEWAIATWIISEQEIVGAKLECGSKTSKDPSSAIIHFAWPQVSENDGPISKLIKFSNSPRFGELPLPQNAQQNNPYNLPIKTTFKSGTPITSVVPRKPEIFKPWSSPKSSLRMKFKESSARHDSYRKRDILNISVSIINTSAVPISVIEGRAFARLRVADGAALAFDETGSGDEDGESDKFVATRDWKLVKSGFLAGAVEIPVTVPAGGTAAVEVYAHLPCGRYYNDGVDPGNHRFSWLVYRAGVPLVLDLEFEDINGEIFGGMVEFSLPDLQLSTVQPDWSFSLCIDDSKTVDRQFVTATIKTETSHEDEYSAPEVARDKNSQHNISCGSGRSLGTSTLRYIVLETEKAAIANNKSFSALQIQDISPICFYGPFPYTSFESTQFQPTAHALVDLSRRSVVAIRFAVVSRSMRAVGYYIVPPYGDALSPLSSAATQIASLDYSDPVVSGWQNEEADMVVSSENGDAVPRQIQEKPNVPPRVQFTNESTKSITSASGNIDSAGLTEALRGIVAKEVADAIPVIVQHVQAAVAASFHEVIDGLVKQIKELEEERAMVRTTPPTPQPPVISFDSAGTAILAAPPRVSSVLVATGNTPTPQARGMTTGSMPIINIPPPPARAPSASDFAYPLPVNALPMPNIPVFTSAPVVGSAPSTPPPPPPQ